MGVFHTDVIVANAKDESRNTYIPGVLVDTGAESSWFPRSLLESIGIEERKTNRRFQMANGEVLTRAIGYAVITAADYQTIDEVVFGEKGDLAILGARTLEGFNARIDPINKQLVAAGPIPAAGNVPLD